MKNVKYPDVHVRLTGHDGNAFAIIGTGHQALKLYGVPKELLDQFRKEAMSSDYDNVLQTAMRRVDVN